MWWTVEIDLIMYLQGVLGKHSWKFTLEEQRKKCRNDVELWPSIKVVNHFNDYIAMEYLRKSSIKASGGGHKFIRNVEGCSGSFS